jgi:hypothetical protein
MTVSRIRNQTPATSLLAQRHHDSLPATRTSGDVWHAEDGAESTSESARLTSTWTLVQDRDGRDRLELRWEAAGEYHRAVSSAA